MGVIGLMIFLGVTLGTIKCQVVPVGPYIQQILDIHNDYRRLQRSSNMQKLAWDSSISSDAQAWAARCNFEHQIMGYGENLAFISGQQPIEEKIRIVMKDMYDEIQYYTYNDQNQCSPWSCHYTQIVWANSTRIGCGMAICDPLYSSGGSYSNAWHFVCFYKPRANFCAPPCLPYLVGPACSQCRPGQGCDDGLCTDSIDSRPLPNGGGQGNGNNIRPDVRVTTNQPTTAARTEPVTTTAPFDQRPVTPPITRTTTATPSQGNQSGNGFQNGFTNFFNGFPNADPVCSDQDWVCPYWAYNGLCQDWRSQMCQYSCGLC